MDVAAVHQLPVGERKERLVRTSIRVSDDLYDRLLYFKADLESRTPGKVSLAAVFRECMKRTLDDERVPDPRRFTGWVALRKYVQDVSFAPAIPVALSARARGLVEDDMPDAYHLEVMREHAKIKRFGQAHRRAVELAWKIYTAA